MSDYPTSLTMLSAPPTTDMPALPDDEALLAEPVGMDDHDLRTILRAEYEDAKRYADDELAPARNTATDYYEGQPFGDETDGRSKVVMTEVRDTVRAVLPSLMRIFTGTEQAMAFSPRGPGDDGAAQQATDYVQFVIFDACDGFTAIHDGFKDALIRKTGVFKWWWQSQTTQRGEQYSGLTRAQVAQVAQTPGAEITSITTRPATPEETQAIVQADTDALAAAQRGIPILLSDVSASYSTETGSPQIAAVPPEEFLISRHARAPRSATYAAHRRIVTQSDLVAMGYDPAVVDELPAHHTLTVSDETRRRNPALHSLNSRPGTTGADRSRRPILYIEHYILADRDGDGIAELLKVCTAGSDLELLHVEPTSSIPFGVICPDPEAHQIVGDSLADLTMDLQRIKSSVMRATLDSLAQSIFPRTAIVENQANVEDAMNTEAGAIIRMRAPGMVQELSRSFLGAEALGVIGYLDATRESRTGISRASQGLSAELMQSTTATAVAATMSAAQDRIDLIARMFGETGIRDLYEGVLGMMATHQPREAMVQLKGEWTAVDPRSWLQKFKVRCNVGIGRGTQQERLQTLAAIAGKQEQILQTLGPSNPVVSIGQYVNTIRAMISLAGWKDTNQFIADMPTDFALPPPPPKPTAEETLLQVEQSKAKTALAEATIQAMSAERTHAMDDEQKRDEARADAVLRAMEMSFKYAQPIDLGYIAGLFAAPIPGAGLLGPPQAPPQAPPGLPDMLPPPAMGLPPEGPPGAPPGLLGGMPPDIPPDMPAEAMPA